MTAGATGAGNDLLDHVLAAGSPAFALLHRPESGATGVVDVLSGEVTRPTSLSDVPLPASGRPGHARHDVLLMVPYRQLAERGFAAPDDGAPLVALSVTEQGQVRMPDLLARLPKVPIQTTNRRFDLTDDQYAAKASQVITDEIGTGQGSNFVIKRSFLAEISAYTPASALSFFRNLLQRERGAYWTFLIHDGDRTLVGATPERHISLKGEAAVMNPISGTYRYPASGPTLQGVTEFLADQKETDELYMVVDEELKMMARICDHGGRLVGPYLKEMARLAHTEYFIEGETTRDVREVLRETMFAPTVIGSPLESAARVISRHEPDGRAYYGGVTALIGRDEHGARSLDSAILIRTADIDAGGHVQIAVGATLVRHSDALSEAAETAAKASGLIAAMESGESTRLGGHPEVRAALEDRNARIAEFWQRDDGPHAAAPIRLAGLKTLVIDAEDTFTAMLRQQLLALGLFVDVRRFDESCDFDQYDLVVMGPGPGDPSALGDEKIAHLRSAIRTLLAKHRPFVAVCLSHQVLSQFLGLELKRRRLPNQGVQHLIDLFGVSERVGFYNTFAAHSGQDKQHVEGVGSVLASRDPDTGEVHALRGDHFASMQFHAESVLTVDGPRIIADAITGVLGQ
jgi:2-amino-4-deoxychorismate synthase